MKDKIKTLIKAIWIFLVKLFEAKDPVSSLCDKKHVVLKGWKTCPDCKKNEIFNEEKKFKLNQRSLFWLYCFNGPHEGEVFALKNRLETLGVSNKHSIVFTPRNLKNRSSYQLYLEDEVTLTTKQGQNFILNGKEEVQASLIDFDIVEILGNEFLVFENVAY